MVDAELAKKLQARRGLVESEGTVWTKSAEASSADARGEWLIVEADSEDWSLLPNRPADGAAKQAPQVPSAGLVASRLAQVGKEENRPVPRPTAFTPPARSLSKEESGDKKLTERERIERERTLRAADCARRWPDLLREDPAETPEGDEDFALTDKDMRVIRADIQRTRAGDPAFQVPEMHSRLENFLTGFCLKERVSYTQGLHEIAAVFTFVRSVAPSGTMDDASALACFATFIHRFVPYFHDKEEFVALHISLLFFRQLLFYHHPDLHNQLEEASVSPFLYATPWFITLFAARTPLSVLLCFWDKYVRRNEACFLPFLAVAMLVSRKAAILSAGLDQAHSEVARAGVKTIDQLEDIWSAAEELRAQTPQSFLLRLTRVLDAVKEKRGQPVPSDRPPWSGRVLAQVERERYFLLLPPEIVAYFVIQIRAAAASSPEEGIEDWPATDGGGTVKQAAQVESKVIKPRLRLLLLDVRPLEEYVNDHLPQALHFHPPCLKRLIASSHSGGHRRLERLAAALSSAVSGLISGSAGEATGVAEQSADNGVAPASAGGGPPAAGSTPPREPGQHPALNLDAALVAEVLEALKTEAAPRWGEEWISDSARAHLVLMGGAADTAELSGDSNGATGAVATLYEALTENVSLARVSVVLGGAPAVHREATKRGLELEQGAPTQNSGTFRRGGSLLNSAWSRLQAASEQLPAADAVSERMGGILGRGADLAAQAAQAAHGIAGSEAVTSVRQRAAEGFSAVWKTFEKIDWEAGMKEDSSERPRNPDSILEANRVWPCELWVTQQGAPQEASPEAPRPPALVEELEGPAALRLTSAFELQLLAAYSAEGGGEGAVAHVFQAEALVRICMPPSRPGVLMFFFPGAPVTASPAKEDGTEEPKRRQPSFLAQFPDAELARECARTIATCAATLKKRQKAAATEGSEEAQEPAESPP